MKLRVVQGNGSLLDPAPIEDLATCMAEETWVDMRVVPGGIAERVQVVGILIRRDGESVQLRQVIQDPRGEPVDNRQWVDSEDIWWARPTSFSPTDEIKTFSAVVNTKLQSVDDGEIVDTLDAAFAAVAWYRRVDRRMLEVMARQSLEANHYRYWVMMVYRAIDRDVENLQITAVFGYRSIQPLYSAKDHCTRGNGQAELDAMIAAAKLRLP